MTHRRRIAFWTIVALQVALLVGMVVLKEQHLAFEDVVVLKAEPVDPLDPMRGHYVDMAYEITTVDPRVGDDGDEVEAFGTGANAWVVLERHGRSWRAEHAYSYPTHPSGRSVIRGTVTNVDRDKGTIEVRYGIETWYASETEAKRLERQNIADRLFVEVALDRDGKPIIRRLIVR